MATMEFEETNMSPSSETTIDSFLGGGESKMKKWMELGRKYEEVKLKAEEIREKPYNGGGQDMREEEERLRDLKASVVNWIKEVEAVDLDDNDIFEEFSKALDELKTETLFLSVVFDEENGTKQQMAFRKGLEFGMKYKDVKFEVGEIECVGQKGVKNRCEEGVFDLKKRLRKWLEDVECVDPEDHEEIKDLGDKLDRFEKEGLALKDLFDVRRMAKKRKM